MRILIDIGHPGDFYLFKNFSQILKSKGHKVLFTVREGENEARHLEYFNLEYRKIGNKKTKILGKVLAIPLFTLKILWISLGFKPTHFVSHGSIYAGLVAFILRKPHIAMEDTGNMEQIRLSKPFSDVILSPDILPKDFGSKHIRYKGYHEICYLHPRYFTPNEDVFTYLGIPMNTQYAILRFISWNASHDVGQRGLTESDKIDLVKKLSSKMKVFISAEKYLNKELEKFRIPIPVHKMHDALAYASIYIGEGATMASEAGVLGTPSIYISSININFNNYSDAHSKIEEFTDSKYKKMMHQANQQKLLKDKINVTAFLVWFVENYPESFTIMKENSDYQYNFKE
jgi:predicted glycosyltransferase